MAIAANLDFVQGVLSDQIDPTYLARLKASRISESILEDVIETYARDHFADPIECEQFIAQMNEPVYEPIMRKAILDVVFTTIAASELPSDLAFQALVALLEVEEVDESVRKVKATFLHRMADTDEDFEDRVISEQTFQSRLKYVEQCIG